MVERAAQKNYLKLMPLLVSAAVLAAGLFAVKYLESQHTSGNQSGAEVAVFGGGCFWGMERAFESREGVIDVVSGYAGGTGEDPTYDDYARNGHTEVVRVTFDPEKVGYEDLLDIYWQQVGAGCQLQPKGTAYRTVIFYYDDEQRSVAEESKTALEKSGIYKDRVATVILPAPKFYEAEEYHQDYYKKMRGQ